MRIAALHRVGSAVSVRRGWCAALLAALLLAACAVPAAEPRGAAPPATSASSAVQAPAASVASTATALPRESLKVAELGVISDASTYFAIERGYFAEQGLDIELARTDPQPVFTLVASGQMDMGMVSVSNAFFHGLGRDLPVRLVAEAARGTPEFSSSGLAVRQDLIASGRVRDYPDLRGLTIALAGSGGLTTMYLGRALERGGLTFDDINLVTVAYPDMLAAFANSAIDAAIQTEPLATLGQQRGLLTKWRSSGELTGDQPTLVLMYGPSLLGERRTAGERFLLAYGRGVRDYYDAFISKRGDRAAAVEILTRYTNVKDAALYDQMGFSSVNPDLAVDIAGIAAQQDWFWQHGLLPELRAPIDVAATTDNRFVERALATLGPYR